MPQQNNPLPSLRDFKEEANKYAELGRQKSLDRLAMDYGFRNYNSILPRLAANNRTVPLSDGTEAGKRISDALVKLYAQKGDPETGELVTDYNEIIARAGLMPEKDSGASQHIIDAFDFLLEREPHAVLSARYDKNNGELKVIFRADLVEGDE